MNTALNKNQIKPQIINENDQMDPAAILQILMHRKWVIVKIIGCFTVIGLIYSFLATPYYKSTITLYPAGEIAGANSILEGGFKGIAESFGIGGLSSRPIYNIPDIIDSRRLKKDIVLKSWDNNLYQDSLNLIKYWKFDKTAWLSLEKWFDKLFPLNRFIVDQNQKLIEKAIENLSDLILVNETVSGLITVSVLMEEPRLAADIANYIAEFVKDFISVAQHSEAAKNKTFIYGQQIQAKEELAFTEERLTNFRKKHPIALDTPDLQLERGRLIRDIEANQAVYITLRQEYEIAKIEEAKERLLINILDNAEPAVKKNQPKRLLILIICIILGAFSGITSTLICHAYNTKK